jgi:aspartyl-tRNA(Asn)/glutamyl-tRNA(Gln) amidotransferase subunit C
VPALPLLPALPILPRVSCVLAFSMPTELTRDEVLKIAALANLRLEPAEIDLFAQQIGHILAYVEQVQQVDTSGVAPTASGAGQSTADRADEIQPCLDIADTLANAPDPDEGREQGGFFKVPRVLA